MLPLGDQFAMMSSTKREALALLAELCELSPDIRLGQLFAHLGFLSEDQTERTPWDIDDEQLLAVLYHHRNELTHRNVPLPLHAANAAPAAAPQSATGKR